MNGKDATQETLARPRMAPSVEITPAEFEYYLRRAQDMRTEASAELLRAALAALRRLFARVKPAPTIAERHEPVLAKPRTA